MRTTSSVAARQAPLRELHARDPAEAITLKRVRTVQRADTDTLHGTVLAVGAYADAEWRFGTDAKVGGLDDLPNAGHILCAALAACMENIIRMIADNLGVDLDHLQVEVTGDVDVRGCMAMEPSVRPGFRWMRCEVALRPDPLADPRRVDVLRAQAERLCVTLDTLRNGVPVEVAFVDRPA